MSLLERRVADRRQFITYLIFALIPSVFVAHLFFYMWTNGVYWQLERITTLPFIPAGAAGIKAIVLFGTGMYVAWLLLFTQDQRKRYQGLVLSIVSIVTVTALAWFGIGIPNLNPTPLNAAALLGGFVLGLLVEVVPPNPLGIEGELGKIDFSKSTWFNAVRHDGSQAEFSVASKALLLFIGTLLIASNVLSWIYVGIETPTNMVISGAHIFVTFVFLSVLNGVIQVKPEVSEQSMEVVGPQQSGKTYMAIALWLTLSRSDEYRVEKPEGDMATIINAYEQSLPDPQKNVDTIDWSLAGNVRGETDEIELTCLTDGFHANRVTIGMHDYPGENLRKIAERFGFEEDHWERVAMDGGEPDSEEDEDTKSEDNDSIDRLEPAESDSKSDSNNTSIEEVLSESAETEKTEKRINAEQIEVDESSGDDSPSARDTDDYGSDDSEENRENQAKSQENQADEETTHGADLETTGEDADSAAEMEDVEENSGDIQEVSAEETAVKDIEESSNDGDEDAVEIMEQEIRVADKLVLLLDSERIMGNEVIEGDEGVQAEELQAIAENTDAEEIILAATKADYLIDWWQDSYDRNRVPHADDRQYRTFREEVEELLVKSQPSIQSLQQAADGAKIYPVYYITKEVKDEGEMVRKPILNRYNQMQPYGYDNLLNALLKEW